MRRKNSKPPDVPRAIVESTSMDILNSFVSVIRRKRFAAVIKQTAKFPFPFCEFKVDDCEYLMHVFSFAGGIKLKVREVAITGRFKYSFVYIFGAKNERFRCAALNLMMKIKNKPLYDIMNT